MNREKIKSNFSMSFQYKKKKTGKANFQRKKKKGKSNKGKN